MQEKTLQQVINDTIAGLPIDPEEGRDTILALHSMLARSRMALEVIAEKMDNAENLYYVSQVFLGSWESVRKDRELWMNTVPGEYLKEQETNNHQITEELNAYNN